MAENTSIRDPFSIRLLHDKLRIVNKRLTYSTVTQFNNSSLKLRTIYMRLLYPISMKRFTGYQDTKQTLLLVVF